MERGCIWNFEMKEPERKLPKSWEEFCNNFGTSKGTYCFYSGSKICSGERPSGSLYADRDKLLLPDRANAEAVLALCQLIQLRNAFNGDWLPDWEDCHQDKYVINFERNEIQEDLYGYTCEILYFKSEELRDEFLRCFRPLIEILKPLYGIKKGGSDEE